MPQREGRPRTSGTGRKKPKHNRCSFSNRHKLEVAKHFFSGGDMKHTMQTFCPFLSGDAKDQRRKLVYKWWYMISVLEERCQSTAVADMKYVRVPVIVTILLREAEAAIVQWINLFRKEGVPISSAMLRMKGAEIADGLGIAAFRGSWHCGRRASSDGTDSAFARTRQGQVTPEKADEAAVRFEDTIDDILSDDELNFSDSESDNDAVAISL
ncbi:hypothetical protein PC111_g9208 [Phytophthora cactorum]|nr:hypothetical protein PC111_g9208 [Phytophthora cactorum]